MMFNIRKLCLAASAVFCALSVLPAIAATKEDKAVVNAAPPRAAFEPNSGDSFCLTDYTYPDGRQLTVALSPANEINLGLTIPNGKFIPKRFYSLTLVPWQSAPRKVRAAAMGEDTLVLHMGNDPSFAKALTSGKSLEFSAGGTTMRFATHAMDSVYAALESCNKENVGKAAPITAPADQAMPETLQALLMASGIKDITPLRMDDIPSEERSADYVWRTGNLFGGVRERDVPKNKSLSKLIGLHIDGLKRKCSGTFRAEIGREKKTSDLIMRPAEVECQMTGENGNKELFVALLFYKTPKNLFTVFTHEGLASDKTDALEARDALQHTLVNLSNKLVKKSKRKK